MLVLKLLFSIFSLYAVTDCKNMDSIVTEDCFYTYEEQFQNLHPNLFFNFDWNEDQPQAFAQGRRVVLSGGFARKVDLTQGGFLTVLCHEVGHAGFGFNEGEADDYASRVCVPDYVNQFLSETEQKVSLAIENFCLDQNRLNFKECKASISMLNNAANADRSRCLKNLLGVDEAQLIRWSFFNSAPNMFHRCLLTSENYPSFNLNTLRDILNEVILQLETPLSLFISDPRVVSRDYSLHNSPQCRMDTFLAGALGLDRPRCWSL